jgi:hypothetical protein
MSLGTIGAGSLGTALGHLGLHDLAHDQLDALTQHVSVGALHDLAQRIIRAHAPSVGHLGALLIGVLGGAPTIL